MRHGMNERRIERAVTEGERGTEKRERAIEVRSTSPQQGRKEGGRPHRNISRGKRAPNDQQQQAIITNESASAAATTISTASPPPMVTGTAAAADSAASAASRLRLSGPPSRLILPSSFFLSSLDRASSAAFGLRIAQRGRGEDVPAAASATASDRATTPARQRRRSNNFQSRKKVSQVGETPDSGKASTGILLLVL